jgi:DNA-binding MarR family transcriptional regulator
MTATMSANVRTFNTEGDGNKLLDELEEAFFEISWLGQKQFAVELAPFKLTIPQFFTLLFVASSERGSTMSELANQTRHSLATMTGIVDRLVKLDLVKRGGNPDDRRIVLVELTEAGRARLEEVRTARRRQLEQAFQRLNDKDQRELVRLLREYSAALGVHESAGPARGLRRARTA